MIKHLCNWCEHDINVCDCGCKETINPKMNCICYGIVISESKKPIAETMHFIDLKHLKRRLNEFSYDIVEDQDIKIMEEEGYLHRIEGVI